MCQLTLISSVFSLISIFIYYVSSDILLHVYKFLQFHA